MNKELFNSPESTTLLAMEKAILLFRKMLIKMTTFIAENSFVNETNVYIRVCSVDP